MGCVPGRQKFFWIKTNWAAICMRKREFVLIVTYVCQEGSGTNTHTINCS